jgi:uncharacterized protein (DUF1499 family)
MPRTLVPALAALATLTLAGCAASPARIEADGADRFAPCPAAPRCATSQRDAGGDYVPPLTGGESAAQAHANLLSALAGDPGYVVLTDEDDYVHAEYTTELMRYQDDVEFLIRDDGTIDVRSASRLGWYDWGTNRRRIERLREALEDDAGS